MARIRSIKPEFWSSPGMAGVDPFARLLYIAMWNWADDNGVGVANPRELLGFAFPWDEEITVADVRRWLVEIRRVFDVNFYTVKGRPYYFIPSWEEHQKFDRRSKGKFPGPEHGQEWDPGADLRKRPERKDSTETHESPSSPRRDSVAGTGEQGNRGTGEQSSSRYVTRSPAANFKFEANRIVNGWLANVEKQPPPQVKNKVLAEVQVIVQAGTHGEDDIVAGLDQWYEGKYPPSTIGSYVWRASQGIDANAPNPTKPKRATGDERAMDILSLQPPGDDDYEYPILEAGPPPEDEYATEPTEWSTT